MTTMLSQLQAADQDYEWYPTTPAMIAAVAERIPADAGSIMDIGAGDGRVLVALAKHCERKPELYAIEKSRLLVQAQPESITPVGTDLYEQNLACLPVDYIFSNPPYSAFETWAGIIIESGFAKRAYLVIPRRWKDSARIADALAKRKATATVIYSGDFHDAERAARAVVDIVEVRYPSGNRWGEKTEDPFDVWFEQNITTFDEEKEAAKEEYGTDLAKLRDLTSIAEMVEAYNEDYARMEVNYRAIFQLDYAILRELGVNKDAVRDGIKKKMAGLKAKYWGLLFEKLDTITNRLATATKKHFLERLTGRAAVAFTANNAHAIVLWAIKHANRYYDQQLIQLFRDLSTKDGVMNYKSNQRTWGHERWRYHSEDAPTHYALDYRIVVPNYRAICTEQFAYEYPGNLHNSCHDLIADMVAVFYNLGYPLTINWPSRNRTWIAGQWQDFIATEDRTLFQVKAHCNGNLHLRIMPEAIKALNVEAGRLLGWLKNRQDVVRELGYSEAEADRYFACSWQLSAASVKLLCA